MENDPRILWVDLSQQIDAAFLDKHPEVRCIAAPFTGLDSIDEAECAKRGIDILSLRGDTEFLRGVCATAEHTVALILALLRDIPSAAVHTALGGWDRNLFQGRELKDCLVGIVGYGRVGRQVERILNGFDAIPSPVFRRDFLSPYKIITVHVPLDDKTRGMCNAEFFSRMKPGSCFINTSRGEVVDESALLSALESGHLAGAALDVVCNERGERNPKLTQFALRHPDRLILTPHIGGNTVESRAATKQRIADKLCAWLASQEKIVDEIPEVS